jgi:hypothetical protein
VKTSGVDARSRRARFLTLPRRGWPRDNRRARATTAIADARRIGFALVQGFALACATSGAIVADRLSCGAFRVVGPSTVLAAACTISLLSLTRRRVTPAAPPLGAAGPWRSRGLAQMAGAVLGVSLVHAALRAAPFAGAAWLCERPPQFVNDFVAAFGALAVMWTCADQPVGGAASLLALAVTACYSFTAPRWHLDPWACPLTRGLDSCVSVQLAVLVQLAATAVGARVLREVSAARQGAARAP